MKLQVFVFTVFPAKLSVPIFNVYFFLFCFLTKFTEVNSKKKVGLGDMGTYVYPY